MILVSMERGDPTLYYGTKQLYFERVNFKITKGGNHTPQEDVLQKILRKTRVKGREQCLMVYVHVLQISQSSLSHDNGISLL